MQKASQPRKLSLTRATSSSAWRLEFPSGRGAAHALARWSLELASRRNSRVGTRDVNVAEAMYKFCLIKSRMSKIHPNVSSFFLTRGEREPLSPPASLASSLQQGEGALLCPLSTGVFFGAPCPLLNSLPLEESEPGPNFPPGPRGVTYSHVIQGRLSPKRQGGERIRRVNLQLPRRWDRPIIPQVEASSIPL